MSYYFSPNHVGLILASSTGDGYTINLKWNKAFPSNKSNKIAYNIYMATEEENIFSEGPKFVSIDGYNSVDIFDLIPGQLYFFAIRAIEYNQSIFDMSNLPVAFNNLIVYPESILIQNITASSTLIPILDTSTFPNFGVVQIGYEMMNYSSKNDTSNLLVLTNAATQRGFFNTIDRIHNTDGYDGYHYISPPIVRFTFGREEDQNQNIISCQSRFEYPSYQFTIPDGYHQVTKDLLTTDLSGSDAFNEDFPHYDYAGYHRTNPVDILTGKCVGSYIGGTMFCADGYSGVGRMVRGLSLQDQNNQRQEMLLNLTGEPVCLLKRMTTGITCSCYTPGQEYADDRCPVCYGTKFVMGYTQFFNPRRSDGRILIRFSPADDDLIPNEAGLESTFTTDCWGLTVPTIKDRDVIVRFDQDGNEEFRYEVLSVNRNKTLVGLQGAQKFRVQRVRKYDPIYRFRVYKNTEFLPQTINTSIASVPGIQPHTHTIVINENITNISQINQVTGVSAGHSHDIIGGIVQVRLGHTHTIIIP